MSLNIYKVDIKYFCIIFLFFIYYIYGLVLSDIVDFVFPDHDENIPNWRTALELVGEILVVYLIYFTLKKYSEFIIKAIFNSISCKTPYYLNQLLLIAFSFGIFKYLKKSNDKMVYLKEKFIK
jgi:hypothetical protein